MLLCNSLTGEMIDTSTGDIFSKNNKSSIDADSMVVNWQDAEIQELLDDIVLEYSDKIRTYYKNKTGYQEVVMQETRRLLEEYVKYWIYTVNKYNTIFLINEKDGATKDYMKKLKKAGVPHLDIQRLMKFAIDIETVAMKYKKLTTII